LIAKRKQEREGGQQSFPGVRQGNSHEVTDLVNIDDIIDYSVMRHEVVDVHKDDEPETTTDGDNELLAFMAGRESNSGDLLQVLAAKRSSEKAKARKVNMTNIFYQIGQHNIAQMKNALVDRGANGGICGNDMLVLEGSERFVDVYGIAGHKVNQLRIVTAQALVTTHKGDAIATFHQMALLGQGKSILSCLQMEAYGADINDRSRLLPGGKQRILIDGYQLPLEFQNGLPYLRCRKPTASELESLPHIIMTSDVDWDPSQYDSVIDGLEEFYDPDVAHSEHEDFTKF